VRYKVRTEDLFQAAQQLLEEDLGDFYIDFINAELWIFAVTGAGPPPSRVDRQIREFVQIEASPRAVRRETFLAAASELEEQAMFFASFPSEHVRTHFTQVSVIDSRDDFSF
jgi:hypothetical protein